MPSFRQQTYTLPSAFLLPADVESTIRAELFRAPGRTCSTTRSFGSGENRFVHCTIRSSEGVGLVNYQIPTTSSAEEIQVLDTVITLRLARLDGRLPTPY